MALEALEKKIHAVTKPKNAEAKSGNTLKKSPTQIIAELIIDRKVPTALAASFKLGILANNKSIGAKTTASSVWRTVNMPLIIAFIIGLRTPRRRFQGCANQKLCGRCK